MSALGVLHGAANSKLTSPPHEYTALHQQGNRMGSGGTAGIFAWWYSNASQYDLRVLRQFGRVVRCDAWAGQY